MSNQKVRWKNSKSPYYNDKVVFKLLGPLQLGIIYENRVVWLYGSQVKDLKKFLNKNT